VNINIILLCVIFNDREISVLIFWKIAQFSFHSRSDTVQSPVFFQLLFYEENKFALIKGVTTFAAFLDHWGHDMNGQWRYGFHRITLNHHKHVLLPL
jgi:hypothetical protein